MYIDNFIVDKIPHTLHRAWYFTDASLYEGTPTNDCFATGLPV